MSDLWPEDIILESEMNTPQRILQKQAEALGNKLDNVVIAKVTTEIDTGNSFQRTLQLFTKSISGDVNLQTPKYFVHRFWIVAPTLQNYRYELFLVMHDINIYPVHMRADVEIMAELSQEEDKFLTAQNEAEFERILARFLAAKKTRQAINSLHAQSLAIV